jgi:dTDP-4-dehydrorhamnose reductase
MSGNVLSRVFITGKNGQVGHELVERAAELNIDAVSFDSSELNICDREKVIAMIADHNPTVVINAAAYTAVDKAEEEADLAYAVNRDGVENLALACKIQNIPLIHLSTDCVFDGTKKISLFRIREP